MTTTLKSLAAVPAVLFVVMGLGWLIAPGIVAGQLRMNLLTGDSLSTQIGDLAALFLTTGICILAALNTGRAVWLYPAIMLLGIAASGRLIAWFFHGAGLTIDMIAVEVVVATLLVVLSGKLADR